MWDIQSVGVAVSILISSIALTFSILTYIREKPKLKIKIVKCVYYYNISVKQVKTLSVHAFFQINNVGDRPTRINKVSLKIFNYEDKVTKTRINTKPRSPDSCLDWVEAHDTIDFETISTMTVEKEFKEKLNCEFTIWDTHTVQIKNVASEREDNFKAYSYYFEGLGGLS